MSKGLTVVLCFALVCSCIAICVTQGPKAKEACKCEGCKCNSKWQVDELWKHEKAWDIDQIKKHLREQGHNIGVAPPRPVGSAK